jgi:PKD repeat protein
MDTNALRGVMRVRLLGIVLTAAALTGCTLKDQDAPELSGPSGLSLSMSVSAAPDHLMQDGSSQAVVTATVRDAQGAPVSGLGINWSVSTSDGSQLEPVTQFSVTNAQGQAQTRVTAPPPPAQVPTSPLTLRVSAQAQGADASVSAPGFERNKTTVEVELVPPAGTPTANRNPVASFTVSPAAVNVNQTVTFDASNSTDETTVCGTRCTYQWDFGDFTTGSGQVVTHSYSTPRTYTVTLTVTDTRGGIGSSSRSVVVNGPTAPIASFSVLPASPRANQVAAFDASASTVGAGATITQYDWSFTCDGSTATAAGPTTTKTFPPSCVDTNGFPVILTITDSLGRTAVKALNVVVQ